MDNTKPRCLDAKGNPIPILVARPRRLRLRNEKFAEIARERICKTCLIKCLDPLYLVHDAPPDPEFVAKHIFLSPDTGIGDSPRIERTNSRDADYFK